MLALHYEGCEMKTSLMKVRTMKDKNINDEE